MIYSVQIALDGEKELLFLGGEYKLCIDLVKEEALEIVGQGLRKNRKVVSIRMLLGEDLESSRLQKRTLTRSYSSAVWTKYIERRLPRKGMDKEGSESYVQGFLVRISVLGKGRKKGKRKYATRKEIKLWLARSRAAQKGWKTRKKNARKKAKEKASRKSSKTKKGKKKG